MVTKDNRVTINFHMSSSYLYLQLTSTTFFIFVYIIFVYVNIPRKYFVCERNQNWSSFISLSSLYVSVFSDDVMLWRGK